MDNHLVVAVDLGGTRIRAALIEESGKIVARASRLTIAEEGRDRVIERLVDITRDVAQQVSLERIQAVGIGAPGPLDAKARVIVSAPNLPGWNDVPVGALMEAALGKPVVVGNDANLAALGEATFGAGKGVRNLVYLTVSTGIGAGIIVDGQLLLGHRGLAGEVGHMSIEAFGPPCACGNNGCLEALASGTAIARKANERVVAGDKTLMANLWAEKGGELATEIVVAAARAGDKVALEIMETAASYLGVGVVNVLHLFNPQMVIIGGGVSNAGDLLFAPVHKMVAQRAMPPYREGLVITAAALGDDAGLLGAAALAHASVG